MLTGPHPDLRRRFQFEMSQTIGLYEAAVAGATGEMGILGTEHEATYCGVNPVGAHQRVDRHLPAVLELRFYLVALIDEVRQAMSQM